MPLLQAEDAYGADKAPLTLSLIRPNLPVSISIDCNQARKKLIDVQCGVCPNIDVPKVGLCSDHFVAAVQILTERELGVRWVILVFVCIHASRAL